MSDNVITIKGFLIVGRNGAMRVTKKPPDLTYDEVSIGISVKLPAALWERPALSAELVVPGSAALPPVVPVEVVNNLQDAIQQATGMEVRLAFVARADGGQG